MSTALAPEMVRRGVRAIGEVVEGATPLDAASDLVAGCRVLAVAIGALREVNRVLFKHGIEASKGRFVLRESLDAVSEALTVSGRIRSVLVPQLTPAVRAELEAALDELEAPALSYQQELRKTLEFAERLRPIDLSKITPGKPEDYTDIKDVLEPLG